MNTFIIVAGVIPPDLNKSIFDVFLFYNLSIFLQSLSLFIFLSRPSSQSVLPSLNGIKPVSAHEGSGSGRTPSAWTAACPGCLAAVPAPLRDSVVKQLLEPAVLFAEMDLYET